jgi:DNA-binding MarR family transcriptional regulator
LTLTAANSGILPGLIAKELPVETSNMAKVVSQLGGAGLVARDMDCGELYASPLKVTEARMTCRRETDRTHRLVNNRFHGRIDAAEMKYFVILLVKLLHRSPPDAT